MHKRGFQVKLSKIILICSLICLLLSVCGGCGISDSLSGIMDSLERISKSFEDLSKKAGTLIGDINKITRLVDSKVESGELSDNVGDLIDEQLSTVVATIESSIQNTGGYLFNEVNGTVDNAFMNISLLLDQIEQGILNNTLPALITQISSQLQIQINSITMGLEDIVVLAFGNTMIIIDKTINSAVIIISTIFLAIGLLIFAIVLVKRTVKLKGTRLVGFIFMIIYIGFFLVILIFPKARANLIVGLDYGKKEQIKQFPPKITGIIPETFKLGKNERIYLYGTHLNQLEKISVKLMQGNTVKFTFPDECLIVATNNRIVLSNFKNELNWKMPKYTTFKTNVLQKGTLSTLPVDTVKEFSYSINQALFPNVLKEVSPVRGRTPVSMPSRSLTVPDRLISSGKVLEYKRAVQDRAIQDFGATNGAQLVSATSQYFLNQYKLSEGDYGLNVFDDTDRIESPQFISIVNPPPPAPKPDISPTDLKWSSNITPVNGEQTSLDLTIGFAYPEEIKRPFKAKIISSPATIPINITVPMGQIAAAYKSNKTTITTSAFTVKNPGNYIFTISIDDDNIIEELDEGNNTLIKDLKVNQEVYEVKLTSFKLEPLKSGKNLDKFYIDILYDVTGYTRRKCDKTINKSGASFYDIACNTTYSNVKPGQVVLINFIVSGEITIRSPFPFIPEYKTVISWVTLPYYHNRLSNNPTSGKNTKEFLIDRSCSICKITGKLIIDKK